MHEYTHTLIYIYVFFLPAGTSAAKSCDLVHMGRSKIRSRRAAAAAAAAWSHWCRPVPLTLTRCRSPSQLHLRIVQLPLHGGLPPVCLWRLAAIVFLTCCKPSTDNFAFFYSTDVWEVAGWSIMQQFVFDSLFTAVCRACARGGLPLHCLSLAVNVAQLISQSFLLRRGEKWRGEWSLRQQVAFDSLFMAACR